MLRKTLTILSLIGLLLSLALWGASYFCFIIWWPNNYVVLATGQLFFMHEEEDTRNAPFAWECAGFGGFEFATIMPTHPRDWWFYRELDFIEFGGPGINGGWYLVPSEQIIISVLLWLPTLLFGIILCLCCRPLHLHRRRKRKKLGLCVKCGYDLRGSTKRCPECNTPIEGT